MTVSQLKERKNELIKELEDINAAINELLGVQQEVREAMQSSTVLNPPSFPTYRSTEPSPFDTMNSMDPIPSAPIDPYQSDEYLANLRAEVKEYIDDNKSS